MRPTEAAQWPCACRSACPQGRPGGARDPAWLDPAPSTSVLTQWCLPANAPDQIAEIRSATRQPAGGPAAEVRLLLQAGSSARPERTGLRLVRDVRGYGDLKLKPDTLPGRPFLAAAGLRHLAAVTIDAWGQWVRQPESESRKTVSWLLSATSKLIRITSWASPAGWIPQQESRHSVPEAAARDAGHCVLSIASSWIKPI